MRLLQSASREHWRFRLRRKLKVRVAITTMTLLVMGGEEEPRWRKLQLLLQSSTTGCAIEVIDQRDLKIIITLQGENKLTKLSLEKIVPQGSKEKTTHPSL
jgi:hypothetical protein